jgi:hypothetical protein
LRCFAWFALEGRPVTRQPTALQRAAYEAVMRLGSQQAAAAELGRHQGTIRGAVLGYCEITGELLPPGVSLGGRVRAGTILRRVPERLVAIEDALASIDERLARLDACLALLTAAIEGFVARQPLILEVRPQHRRQVDGGEGGRREHRGVARDLRKVAGE